MYFNMRFISLYASNSKSVNGNVLYNTDCRDKMRFNVFEQK